MAESPFDAAMKAANSMFFAAFGADGGLSYTPQGGSPRTISAIRVDEKTVNRLAPNQKHEFEEQRWKISSKDDSEGVIDVKVLGFKGQSGDRVTIGSDTWFVVHRDAGNDPGMQIIVIRDKAVPYDYDNE